MHQWLTFDWWKRTQKFAAHYLPVFGLINIWIGNKWIGPHRPTPIDIQMKISHNNHSYLSPSKLNSLATVKTLLSPSNADDTYTTTTDLDKLIIDQTTDNLTTNCDDDDDDETNDNILSTMPAYTDASPYRNYLLADNSIDYVDQLNGSIDTDDALSTPKISVAPFRFSDYTLQSFDASSTTIRSTTTASIATPKTPDFLTKDFSPLNRIQNIDDLLSYTATNTTANTTTSSTLNSWNDANSEFARKELAHSTASTRKPLLSAQNRFLSLSISPPLSRRQDMPVLRGTFVSL